MATDIVQNDLFGSAFDSLVKEVNTSTIRVSKADLAFAAKKMHDAGYELNSESRKALVAYMEGKSLFIAGPCGTGKTEFFKALNRSGVAQKPITIYSLKLHDNDSMEEVDDFLYRMKDEDIVIDDVGAEHDKLEYGNHRDVLAYIIAFRENCKARTFYTTNLKKVELLTRYGERILSRFKIHVMVMFIGEDRRTEIVNEAAVAYQQQCTDPKNWILCKERCPKFVNGECMRGEKVPPILRDMSPEKACGVGEEIPYRKEYFEDEENFRRARANTYAKAGLPVPEYLQKYLDNQTAQTSVPSQTF